MGNTHRISAASSLSSVTITSPANLFPAADISIEQMATTFTTGRFVACSRLVLIAGGWVLVKDSSPVEMGKKPVEEGDTVDLCADGLAFRLRSLEAADRADDEMSMLARFIWI